MGKRKRTVEEQKQVSFGRLAFEALPEMWGFQFTAALILAVIAKTIIWAMSYIGGTGIGAATTANIKTVLLSWRSPVLLLLGIIVVLCYIVIELFSQT